MSVGEFCNRDVLIVEKTESIRQAIELMRSHHVGDVIVVEKRDGVTAPLGILTDRDIVVEILAEDVDFDSVNIGDVMSDELVTVHEETELMDAIKLLRGKGVRRAPVVDEEEDLIGILTVDDILALVAEQLVDITGLITRERSKESKQRK